MNIIKSLFKPSKTNIEIGNQNVGFPWITISDIEQIKSCVDESNKKTVVIFKHSTRCGTSRAVLKAFEKQTEPVDEVRYYYLDLIKYRDISNAIAHDLEIIHQSPQLIVLEKRKVRSYASHYDLLNIVI